MSRLGSLLGCALVALLLILNHALRKTVDLDVYWHLAIGKAALAQRSTLPAEIFSYSAAGAPWPYKDLLADVLLYLGFAHLGHAFFALLKAACAAALLGILWAAGGRRSWALWLLTFGLLLRAIGYRLLERPLLFSLVLFPLALLCCERVLAAYRAGDATGRDWAPLLGSQWLWAQLHREATLGLTLIIGLGVYLAGARALGRPCSRRALALALGAPVAALGLTLMNPSGAALLRTSVQLTQNEALQRSIIEWRRFSVFELVRTFGCPTLMALALLVAVPAVLLQRWRGRSVVAPPWELWHLAWLLLLTVQSLRSVRWVPQLSLLCALLIMQGLSTALGQLPRRTAPFVVLLVFGMLNNPYPPGVGEAPDKFPAGALAFARAAGLRGKVVNTYDYGGYLIYHGWPELRVHIDGRHDMVYTSAFVERAFQASADPQLFQRMRAEDQATWVLAQNEYGYETFTFLARDPAWALVYYSEAAVIYVRRDQHPALAARALPSLARTVGLPLHEGSNIMLEEARAHRDALLAELERAAQLAPTSKRLGLLRGAVLDALGPEYRPQRDALMRALLRDHPELADGAE